MATNAEEWRPVPGYAGYEASSLGRIRNAATGRVYRICLNGGGYPHVSVRVNGKRVTKTTHVLVAAAFLGPRPTTPRSRKGYFYSPIVINHKDHDRANNESSNLEYTTAWLNVWHGKRIRSGEIPEGTCAVAAMYFNAADWTCSVCMELRCPARRDYNAHMAYCHECDLDIRRCDGHGGRREAERMLAAHVCAKKAVA